MAYSVHLEANLTKFLVIENIATIKEEGGLHHGVVNTLPVERLEHVWTEGAMKLDDAQGSLKLIPRTPLSHDRNSVATSTSHVSIFLCCDECLKSGARCLIYAAGVVKLFKLTERIDMYVG